MRYIESQYRSIYISMLVNFVFFGVTLTIIGATLPKIIREFQWSYVATGFVVSAGSLGYLYQHLSQVFCFIDSVPNRLL